MTGLTDYWARKVLDHTTGKTAIGAVPTAYIGLFTAAPTDAGGGTEVTGNGYARITTSAANWNAASASAPSLTSNGQGLSFPAATGAGWGTVVAMGIFDAASAGNLLWWDYLGNFPWLPFTSAAAASPAVLEAPGHSFANGDSIVVTAEYGGTLPPTAGSWTGLLTVAGATTDTLTAGVNTTGSGDGQLRKVASQAVPGGVTVSFSGGTPGQLQLTLA